MTNLNLNIRFWKQNKKIETITKKEKRISAWAPYFGPVLPHSMVGPTGGRRGSTPTCGPRWSASPRAHWSLADSRQPVTERWTPTTVVFFNDPPPWSPSLSKPIEGGWNLAWVVRILVSGENLNKLRAVVASLPRYLSRPCPGPFPMDTRRTEPRHHKRRREKILPPSLTFACAKDWRLEASHGFAGGCAA